jgi:hypothetical protein
VAHVAEPLLVRRPGHLANALRRRATPRTDRSGARRLRRQRGELPADRARARSRTWRTTWPRCAS